MRPALSFVVSTCAIFTAMTCGIRVQQLVRGSYGDDDDPKWIRLCTLTSNGNSSQLNISMPCNIRIEDESDDNQDELVDDDIDRDDHEVMVNVDRPTVSNVSYEIAHANVRPNQVHADRRSATGNATDGAATVEDGAADDGAATVEDEDADDGATTVEDGAADDGAATVEDEDADDGAATVEDEDADDGAAAVEDEDADDGAATVDDDDGAAIVSDEDGHDGVEVVTVVGTADGDGGGGGGDDDGRDALERRRRGEAKNAVLAYLTGARHRLYDKIRDLLDLLQRAFFNAKLSRHRNRRDNSYERRMPLFDVERKPRANKRKRPSSMSVILQPSMERSLMTMSFLMFGVFVIQVVQRLMQTLNTPDDFGSTGNSMTSSLSTAAPSLF